MTNYNNTAEMDRSTKSETLPDMLKRHAERTGDAAMIACARVAAATMRGKDGSDD